MALVAVYFYLFVILRHYSFAGLSSVPLPHGMLPLDVGHDY
jgi:hypothetical protein